MTHEVTTTSTTPGSVSAVLSKVPAVTLTFWIVKILATTLGETGGDAVTMTWLGETTAAANPNGYLIGTAIFASALVVLVILQIIAKKFHPFLYWTTIIASTTAGTTLADFADRSLGVGYTGGSAILFLCVMTVLGLWYWSEGTIAVETVSKPKTEAFYWATITFSQTLGTALGDWMADTSGFGFFGAALVFMAALAVVAVLYYWTNISRVLLFWSAFILTRPLGATVGDFLDKPLNHGGLNFSRPLATSFIVGIIVVCVLFVPQRPGLHPSSAKST
jgi:uncharacterized membrane-anchored protein